MKKPVLPLTSYILSPKGALGEVCLGEESRLLKEVALRLRHEGYTEISGKI